MTYELMTMNQLDAVSGGTNGEYRELRDMLPEIRYENFWRTTKYRKPNFGEVQDWLRRRVNVVAKIDVGDWWNPLDSAGEKNFYKDIFSGEVLTHSEIVARVKTFIDNFGPNW